MVHNWLTLCLVGTPMWGRLSSLHKPQAFQPADSQERLFHKPADRLSSLSWAPVWAADF